MRAERTTEQSRQLGLSKAAPLSYAALGSRLCKDLSHLNMERQLMADSDYIEGSEC